MDLILHATQYIKRKTKGDFLYMIQQDINNGVTDTLYIYNDNIEAQTKEHIISGAGNACIREFNIYNPEHPKPYSAGISTGSRLTGGFKKLTKDVKLYIDAAIDIIIEIIHKHNIKHIYYSCENKTGILGISIFKVNMNVRKYITNRLANLSIYEISIEI